MDEFTKDLTPIPDGGAKMESVSDANFWMEAEYKKYDVAIRTDPANTISGSGEVNIEGGIHLDGDASKAIYRPSESFAEPDIETRMDFARCFTIKKLIKRLGKLDNGKGSGVDLVHRTDYHQDGSESEYFYLELSEEQYNALLK